MSSWQYFTLKKSVAKNLHVSMKSQNISYNDRGRNNFLRMLSERKIVDLVKA
jgi:hypothetical protein